MDDKDFTDFLKRTEFTATERFLVKLTLKCVDSMEITTKDSRYRLSCDDDLVYHVVILGR